MCFNVRMCCFLFVCLCSHVGVYICATCYAVGNPRHFEYIGEKVSKSCAEDGDPAVKFPSIQHEIFILLPFLK